MAARIRALCASKGTGNYIAKGFNYLDHGSALIERLWWPLVPDSSGRVYGDVVPHDAVPVVLAEFMRNQPLAIPELGGACVRDSVKRRCGGRSPIGRQDWLPHDKSPHWLPGELP